MISSVEIIAVVSLGSFYFIDLHPLKLSRRFRLVRLVNIDQKSSFYRGNCGRGGFVWFNIDLASSFSLG